MRLLLDESLPRQLARELSGHEATTVVQRGWAGLGNGELLRRAVAEGFDVLVTGDRNIRHQQSIPALAIGVVVVAARTNRIEDLLPLVPKVLEALAAVRPGELREVGG
ncbi:MAG: DUF5615 family PIN-like protein [Acidobacteriota bacterium]